MEQREYIVLSQYLNGDQTMDFVGRAKASSAKKAILKVIEKTSNRPVQLKKQTSKTMETNQWVAVPKSNWNVFEERY